MQPVGETEFVAGVAAMSDSGQFGPVRACAALFGAVDLTLGSAAEEVLAAHVAAAGGRFRGIRASTCWHADPRVHRVVADEGVLLRKQTRDVVAALERLGLMLDVWVYHTQLPDVMAIADAQPNLDIVLDHFGTPVLGGPYRGRRDEVFSAWKADIRELAKRPNVTIKLGALPIRTADATADRNLPPTSEEVETAWRPWFDAAVEVFGCNRAMFESNFPVHKNWCSYHVHWNACKRLAAGFSETEQDGLFRGTAQRVYRIDLE
jgi:predicted TIM-barrel fold metal-dependent hydrolase